jgi:hypothetical protein
VQIAMGSKLKTFSVTRDTFYVTIRYNFFRSITGKLAEQNRDIVHSEGRFMDTQILSFGQRFGRRLDRI